MASPPNKRVPSVEKQGGFSLLGLIECKVGFIVQLIICGRIAPL